MEHKHVDLSFKQAFEGELTTERGKFKIGASEGTLLPYDMLLAALGSCLYATFLEIIEKKRIQFEKVEITIDGDKRDGIPATLNNVHLALTVYGASKETGFDQALKLSTEYCSVYQTISKVAEMSYSLSFK